MSLGIDLSVDWKCDSWNNLILNTDILQSVKQNKLI